MIIVVLTYIKPLAKIDSHLPAHLKFLDEHYANKKFLVSGKRDNRVGGIIIVLSDSIEEAQSIMSQDPFYTHNLASYDYLKFEASKFQEAIADLL